MCNIFLRIMLHFAGVFHRNRQVGYIMPDMPGSEVPNSTTLHLLLVYIGTLIHTYLRVSVKTNKQRKTPDKP